jgi:hydroxyacylglutathione hydrolase
MADIKRFILDGLDSNSYVITTEEGCYIVDIGGVVLNNIVDYIKSTGKELKAIILTHGHIDHIEGINIICEEFGDIPVYIGREDEKFLTDKSLNLAVFFPGKFFSLNESINVKTVTDGDIVDEKFEIIETPGHTAGSITIIFKELNALFTGDTMFKGNIGRTDLPTGDYKTIWKSLKKITLLDENFLVYPGHGDFSNVKNEKESLFSESEY